MADWPLVAVRSALYLDLGLAFGLPFFLLYMAGKEQVRWRGVFSIRLLLVLIGGAGLLLSLLGLGLMVAAMSGTSLGELDPTMLDLVVTETPVGTAFLVRMAALLLFVFAGFVVTRAPGSGLALASAAGSVALASLAWNGHAAATEGDLAAVHLGSDIVHLWAAGIWVGALFALLGLVRPVGADPSRLRLAHNALERFSRLGTAAVLVLLATGIVNGALLVEELDAGLILASRYGQLLLVKLALFTAMLALAATNRFRLTPQLGAALDGPDYQPAVARLRWSIGTETAAAVVILALVGWLGTLEPPAAL